MPEEKYRTVADHLSDVIYAYLDEYKEQGLLEGLNSNQIVVTGNPIVDVLNEYFYSGKIRMSTNEVKELKASLGIQTCDYSLMTCHRRENVESEYALRNILNLAATTPHPVIFPASYRTQRSIQKFGLVVPTNVNVIDPIGYVELLELVTKSEFVLTDSGTVVEETAVLNVPSIQMRSSTERPQVYDSGSSVKFDPHIAWSSGEIVGVVEAAQARTNLNWEHGLGDGKASDRIVADLLKRISEPEGFRGHNPVGTNRSYLRNQGFGLSGLGEWTSKSL
jgi:UDP-N-acetylglucosamine 2-epimerase